MEWKSAQINFVYKNLSTTFAALLVNYSAPHAETLASIPGKTKCYLYSFAFYVICNPDKLLENGQWKITWFKIKGQTAIIRIIS